VITAGLAVTGAGWRTTYQDLGRHDAERLGVPTGGAADQQAAMIANVLVGNPRGATVLETLGPGLALVGDADLLVAVTGAECRVSVDGTPVDTRGPVVVPRGRELRVHELLRGARNYLAVHGTITAPTFLGSCAPDPRMGFGQVVRPGDRVEVRSRFTGSPHCHFGQLLLRLPIPASRLTGDTWTVDVVATAGLREITDLREVVAESAYTVTSRSDHVGLRLDGPVRHPDGEAELASHGVPIGALEIPHGDELIVLGRYRTLTAGYPLVGVAARVDLPLLGQAGPGQRLRFRWTDRESAVHRAGQQEAALRTLERATVDAFAASGLPGTCPPRK
jgi:biotin-dependent carboxylase-like uncharacterized protein